MPRKFINHHSISTTKYGNVYETTLCDKYGRMVKSRVSKNYSQAKATHEEFVNYAYNL